MRLKLRYPTARLGAAAIILASIAFLLFGDRLMAAWDIHPQTGRVTFVMAIVAVSMLLMRSRDWRQMEIDREAAQDPDESNRLN